MNVIDILGWNLQVFAFSQYSHENVCPEQEKYYVNISKYYPYF